MFLSWLPDDSVMVEWSDSDDIQMRKESQIKGYISEKLEKLLDSAVDCQKLFGEKMNSCRQYNLSEALFITDSDSMEGEHDALVDAYNTAVLFGKLMTEPELEMSCYFYYEDEPQEFFSNPFADLLKNCSCAS